MVSSAVEIKGVIDFAIVSGIYAKAIREWSKKSVRNPDSST